MTSPQSDVERLRAQRLQFKPAPIVESEEAEPSESTELSRIRQQRTQYVESGGVEKEKTGLGLAEVPVQAALGVAKRWTWGADLFKGLVTASAEDELRDQAAQAAQEGRDFDPRVANQIIRRYSDYIPTQDLAEKIASDVTGVELRPTSGAGKFARGTGEIAGFRPGQLSKQIPSRIGTAIAGETTKQGLEAAGVHPAIAGLAGMTVGGAPTQLPRKALSAEAAQARQIAERHGLPKYAGIEAEAAPKGIKPKMTEAALETGQKKLAGAQEQAVEKAVKERLPATEMQRQGINLEDAYKTAYAEARTAAESGGVMVGPSGAMVPVTIETKPIIHAIDGRIAQIKSKRTVPTLGEKEELNILQRQRNGLAKHKEIPATQALDDYHGFNADQRTIQMRPEFRGTDSNVVSAYEGMKHAYTKALEKASPQVAEPFKQANNYFHEASKLREANKIMEAAFKNGYSQKSLDSLISNPGRSARLRKLIGQEGVDDLKDIAKYGKVAQERVFSRIEGTKNLAQALGPVDMIMFLGKLPFKLPIYATKGMLRAVANIRAKLLLSPNGRIAYRDYLKQTAAGTSGANAARLQKATLDLQRAIEEEVGDQAAIRALLEE